MNNNKNEFKRIKHGQLPGDLPKRFKIRMREERSDIEINYASDSYIVPKKAIKSWLRILFKKGRAVSKEKTNNLISEQMEE